MNVNSPPKSLPEILPIFPLTGALLLPGTVMPLHIFEPRYRSMVEDALRADGVFGMIQPIVPRQDNRPEPAADQEAPELYKVGCAGYVERWQKLSDGRFMIQLKGVNRFQTETELSLVRGYRRVKANYEGFSDAVLDPDWRCDRASLIECLLVYAKAHGLEVEPTQLDQFPDIDLVNLLGVSLPFHPAEKQALLEAPSLKEREAVLCGLLKLGAGSETPGTDVPKRTLN
jgi:uncharacterized protein